MPSEISNYLANLQLGWMTGTDMPTAPADVYVALFNGDPTATGAGGTEVTTVVRPAGRPAITWSAITSRAISNDANVDFGAAAGGTQITHAALYDAPSGGNMLAWSPLDNARTVAAGDPVVIPTGDLVFNYN